MKTRDTFDGVKSIDVQTITKVNLVTNKIEAATSSDFSLITEALWGIVRQRRTGGSPQSRPLNVFNMVKTPYKPSDVLGGLITRSRPPHARTGEEFAKLKASGAIVFNDIDIAHVLCEQQPVLRSVSEGNDYNVLCYTDHWRAYGLPFVWWLIGYWAKIGDFGYQFNASIDRNSLITTYEYAELSPTVLDSLAGYVYNQSLSGLPSDDQINDTLGRADKGYVDFFTTMAELPKVLKSAYSGLMRARELASDLKHRRFSLLIKKQRLKIRYEKVYDTYRQTPNSKTYHAWRAANRRRKQDLRQLAQESSNAWLNYRYNIMPIVYTIDGVGRALEKKHLEYRKWRTKVCNSIIGTFPMCKEPFQLERVTRVLIKARMDLSIPQAEFRNSVIMNLPLTAWELVPYSFVIDWFIPVGDALSRLTPRYSLQEESMWSHRASGTITVNVLSESGSYVPVKVRYNNYRAKTFNARRTTPSLFGEGLNLVRIIDSFALSWNRLKRLI